jgi:hypothetical protein
VALVAALVAASAMQAGPSAPAGPNIRPASRAPGSGSLSRLELLPAQAQSVISTTLGSGEALFAPRRAGNGYRISGGGVWADLNGKGALFGAGGQSLSMALAGVGRGGRLSPLGPASSSVRANRVSYDHARAGLREWYAAGPLGVEQGFTLARRPAGGGALTLALSLAGSLSAASAGSSGTARAASQILFRTPSGRLALRYGGLSVLDARGRKLPATFALQGHSLLLQISDRGARYPLRIDPFVQQGEKLVGDCTEHCEGPRGTGEVGNGSFGWSVALSREGDTALIGAPTDKEQHGEQQGAAWVFTRTGNTWTQQGGKLTGAGELGPGTFGWSVALSADGNTALIGGPHDHGENGAAWVFTRSESGAWTPQGVKLTGAGEEGQGDFGFSVALSAEGNTALIGGPGDGGEKGAAWVFTRAGGTWNQQGGPLTGAGKVGQGLFGESVALSSDGNTALIGGPGDSSSQGAAWVFTRSGETWAQQGEKLATGLCLPAEFGASVALSSDGNSALIGGPLYSLGQGAAWVFSRSGGNWTQQGEKLMAAGEVGEGRFGESVALSGEGDLALISAPHNESNTGAAWVFSRSGGNWTQQGEKLTAEGEVGPGQFGESVALSSATGGDTALIGGYHDTGAKGAAWVFSSSSTPTTTTNTPPATSTPSQCPTTTTSSSHTTSTSSPTTTSTANTEPAPILANATESHKVWRESGRLAGTGVKAHSASRRTRRPPLGTTFSFSLNEQASVTFAFDLLLPGRKVAHKCVARTRRNAKRGACKRTVVAGTFSYAGRPGQNNVPFRGHISGSRWLTAGNYTLTLAATNAEGERSSAKTLSFTITR